jgi:hypothetical protein
VRSCVKKLKVATSPVLASETLHRGILLRMAPRLDTGPALGVTCWRWQGQNWKELALLKLSPSRNACFGQGNTGSTKSMTFPFPIDLPWILRIETQLSESVPSMKASTVLLLPALSKHKGKRSIFREGRSVTWALKDMSISLQSQVTDTKYIVKAPQKNIE